MRKRILNNKLFIEKYNVFLKCIRTLFQEYGRIISIGLILGTLVYLPLMSGNLVNNFDGIWHPSYFVAGNWEISLGRGLQRYADRARFGLVTSSFNSLLVLFLITISDVFIIKKLQIGNFFVQMLFLFLSIANPVICESLSYSYMSINFGLAYLFSVLAFYMVCYGKKYKFYLDAIFAAIFFAISMGFYQAYMGVTFVLIIVFLLKSTIEKIDNKLYFKTLLNSVIMLFIGTPLYIGITKILCYKAGVSLSSYKGADNVSLINIVVSLPKSIVSCYEQFYEYVISKNMGIHLEFCHYIVIAFLLVEVVSILYRLYVVRKQNSLQIIISTICFLLLPVAACSVCAIAIGNEIRGLMATGIVFALIIPMITFIDDKITSVMCWFILLLLSFYLVSAVERDQIALHEGKVATTTLVQNIFNQIYESDYLEQTSSVAFIGRVADNPTFRKSITYESANEYAQFGKWSTDTRNNRVTWEGVINEFCGMSVNMCGDETYEQIKNSDQIRNMPLFPYKGSISIVDDVLVIKVSDNY